MNFTNEEQANIKLNALKTAAADLFSSIGYHAVSLRDLAKKIKLSPGAIYNYIDSKQELLFTLTEESLEQRIHLIKKEISCSMQNGSSLLDAVTQGFIIHSSNGKLGIALAIRESSNLNKSQRTEIQRLLDIQNSIIVKSLTSEFDIKYLAAPLLNDIASTLTELLDGYFFAAKLNLNKNPTFLLATTRASAASLLTPFLNPEELACPDACHKASM
ncbi:transcriptional regulator [Pseudomonas sp. GM50]|uniref:TetR/AcrR family transcriptional regulator n=1 Tax=Pseudomonas sp. GM50 TaxID=1144332 RepID=UPI0002707132|nr:TetR/AcrR family transcriptional regulator [Pseudomonas sp. GM50]EJM61906.1 transcriptional regulator [Pseudomonas sp. GM50]